MIIVDAKGIITNRWTVNPKPTIGKYNDIFPPSDWLSYSTYRKSLDSKMYGKSDFFNIIDTAEAIANSMQEKNLSTSKKRKYHSKII